MKSSADNRWPALWATFVLLGATIGAAAPQPSPLPPASPPPAPRTSPRFIGDLDEPSAVAVGPDGSIHICEALSHRVSVFDRNGAPIRHWGKLGRDEGAFDEPRGIAVADDGAVYVADTGNHRIQVFTPAGRFERTWGRFGSDAGEFNEPLGLTVIGERVYVADSRNNRVQVFERGGRFISYIWNYGFLEGAFDRPVDVAADQDGNLYVSDQGNARIQKFAPGGRFLVAWGGKGRQGGLLDEPGGIALRAGRLVVTDPHTSRLVAFDSSGALLDEWTTSPGEEAPGLEAPAAVAASGSGTEIVICSAIENRCQLVSDTATLARATSTAPRHIALDGYRSETAGDLLVVASRETGASLLLDLVRHPPALVGSWGAPGREPLEFVRPEGCVLDQKRGSVTVSDSGNFRLQVIQLGRRREDTGRLDPARIRFIKSIFLADQEGLDVFPAGWALHPAALEPGAIVRDARGMLFIIDTLYQRVVMMNEGFRLAGSWGGFGDEEGRFRRPVDLALDQARKTVYVLDAGRRSVQAFDLRGRFRFEWGAAGTRAAEFVAPAGIATGKDGSVYVIDRGAGRLKKFDRRGKFIGAWGRPGTGRGEFFKPESVSVDGQGNVIVIDSGNRRLEAFSPEGGFLWEMSLDPAAITTGRALRE